MIKLVEICFLKSVWSYELINEWFEMHPLFQKRSFPMLGPHYYHVKMNNYDEKDRIYSEFDLVYPSIVFYYVETFEIKKYPVITL